MNEVPAMREITAHKVNGCNQNIGIGVVDEPGSGGASHQYMIDLFSNPDVTPGITGPSRTLISFQNGPIKEVGTNGVTHEALLAIVIDRLQSFQKGPFACRENALALTKIEEAMHWLNSRTKARVARGVEGTHVV